MSASGQIQSSSESFFNQARFNQARWFTILLAFGLCCIVATMVGYRMGSDRTQMTIPLPLGATSTDSAESMAMATGPVSDDAEGVFFLDFNTGDLQCLVYYPRTGSFGARYYTNVRTELGTAGKNSKYLMVTGAISARGGTGGPRPGNCLVYVTDVTTGMFAAYGVPWDRTAEPSGRPQAAPLIFVQGGPVRNYQIAQPPAPPAEPPKVTDPARKP